jgi:hypothetical protein
MKNHYTLMYSFIVPSNYLQFHCVQNPYVKASVSLERPKPEQYQVKSHLELNWGCNHTQKKQHHLAIILRKKLQIIQLSQN